MMWLPQLIVIELRFELGCVDPRAWTLTSAGHCPLSEKDLWEPFF